MVGALGRARTAIPPCVACVNLCSLPRGGYRQTERGVRGWRAWARPHGDSAVRRLCESLFSTARRIPSDGEGSAWMARLGAPARRFRRASPECESHSTLYRTAIFAVLNGRPLHSDHALPSPLSSLLSAKNKIWIIFYQIFVLAVIAIVHHTGKEVREWARN